jgi:non-specific protein-tyrosine kinase
VDNGYIPSNGRDAPGHVPPGYVSVASPEEEGLTLRDYLAVVWRRKWIILLVVIVATGAAYFFSARQPEVYQAKTDLIYEQTLDVANPLTGASSYNSVYDRAAELQSVGAVIKSPEMRKRAAAKLAEEGFTVDLTSDENAPVTVTAEVPETGSDAYTNNVVSIIAESESPELAAAAANAYAAAFVAARKQQMKDTIADAIEAIKVRLAQYEGAAKESTDYLVLQQRLSDLEIASAMVTGNFRQLVPATPPTEPIEPQPLRAGVLGLAVGLFAGIGLAFLLEQFDTRLRRPDEIANVVRTPVLGRVPRIRRKLLDESVVVTLHHPDGYVAEAFRVVRTNVDFMVADKGIRSIVMTSALQGEGKSVATANLAVAMALAGKKVVLVDADLRRPRQHKFFGVDSRVGVSTVATGATKLPDALQAVELVPQSDKGSKDFTAWARGTDTMSRFYVLPAGPIPPNPGEIVSSRRFQAMLDTLEEKADVVLIDSPAMLAVGDTAAIAATADGLIYLVDIGVLRRPQLASAADQLHKLPCALLGIVVRMESGRVHGSYYQPYYYSTSYAGDGDGQRRRTATETFSDAAKGVIKG